MLIQAGGVNRQQQPDMTFMMQQLIMLQQQQLAMAQNFAAATTTAAQVKYPSIKFPKWDGQRSTVPVFLAQLDSYKREPYFAAVTDWTTTMQSNKREIQRVYSNMLSALSQDQLTPFLNNVRFANDGIAMTASLVKTINPSRPEHRLQDVMELSLLEQGNQE